jgi:hypothetical protein
LKAEADLNICGRAGKVRKGRQGEEGQAR